MPNLTTSRQHTARCQVLTLFPQRHGGGGTHSSVCVCLCVRRKGVCARASGHQASSPHADSQQRHPHHRRLHTHRPRVVRSTANVPVTRPKYPAVTAPGAWLGLVAGAMPWSRVRVKGFWGLAQGWPFGQGRRHQPLKPANRPRPPGPEANKSKDEHKDTLPPSLN